MIDLERRLADLGDALDLGDTDLADAVLGRLDEPVTANRRSPLLVAAAVAAVLATAVVALPDTRSTLARWLELDGLRIERRTDVETPPAPDPGGPRVPGRGVRPGRPAGLRLGPDEAARGLT